ANTIIHAHGDPLSFVNTFSNFHSFILTGTSLVDIDNLGDAQLHYDSISALSFQDVSVQHLVRVTVVNDGTLPTTLSVQGGGSDHLWLANLLGVGPTDPGLQFTIQGNQVFQGSQSLFSYQGFAGGLIFSEQSGQRYAQLSCYNTVTVVEDGTL